MPAEPSEWLQFAEDDLAAAGTPFPRTHDLLALALLTSDQLRADLQSVDLSLLDPWVVDARYPADIPEVGVSDAHLVLDIAERTLRVVRSVLAQTDP